MPNENEKIEKAESQNPPPGEIDDNAKRTETTVSKKGSLISKFGIFKHLLPALKEAFAAGTKTFKMHVQSIPEPKQSDVAEEPQKDALPNVEESKDETKDDGRDEGGEKSLPQQQAGWIKSNLAAGSKTRKLLLASLIALIIIIPVCGGLYMGGMFDEEGNNAEKSDKPVSAAPAAPQEESRKESIFDSLFGKKSQKPPTPKEQLAAMHITYNPNSFIKYAGQNDIIVVKLFLKSGMHPDTKRPIDGFTPLMAAATFDRTIIAEFLLEKGADINLQDDMGQTALMKAVRHNRPHVVEMLLGKKADYHIVDKEGNTALSLANEHSGDSLLAQAFTRFSIDISTAKKETLPQKTLESVLPSPNRAPTSAPSQTKPSRYPEISVQEFLKLLETKPESAVNPAPAPTPN